MKILYNCYILVPDFMSNGKGSGETRVFVDSAASNSVTHPFHRRKPCKHIMYTINTPQANSLINSVSLMACHFSFPLMNSFNNTEAAIFTKQATHPKDFLIFHRLIWPKCQYTQ